MIKADNYNYTKNINKKHIDIFEKDLKDLGNQINTEYDDFFSFDLGNSLADNKRKILQIYDFIYDFNREFIIVFDGDNDFQIWGNFSSEDKKNIKNKFKTNNRKKISLFKVNYKNGLVTTYFENINNFKNFKKSEITMDNVYKKHLKKKFNWKVKISKKVQDYLKFKHDQLIDMVDFKNHLYKLEDREDGNFYKQVRKASYEIIKKPKLNNFKLGVHVIKRMEERSVSPAKFLTVINEGTQIRSDALPHKIFIKKGSVVIVADNRYSKFLTVIRNNNFSDLDGKNLLLELEQGYFKAADSKKEIILKDLEKFSTIEEVKNHLNITEEDYKKDEFRIENSKKKSLLKPLVSNPPYVGDMLEYIKIRQKQDSKLACILNNLISLFENKLT